MHFPTYNFRTCRHSGRTSSGTRTRRERLEALQANWKEQMPQLVDAFLHWKHSRSDSPESSNSTADEAQVPNTIITPDQAHSESNADRETRYFDITAVRTDGKRVHRSFERITEPCLQRGDNSRSDRYQGSSPMSLSYDKAFSDALPSIQHLPSASIPSSFIIDCAEGILVLEFRLWREHFAMCMRYVFLRSFKIM